MHPDLPEERRFVERAYERLEWSRALARQRLEEALRAARGGTPGARAERDVVVRESLARIDQLDIGSESLVFGRIDSLEGEALHIGRLGVLGEEMEPLVVDWRAPAAEPFYRATAREPMGLVRRRHFLCEGRRVLQIEDEILRLPTGSERGDGVSPDGDSSDAGPIDVDPEEEPAGSLLAALERSRSGRMRDIVATIQREQDEIIRAPLAGALVVEGGPGTGKTAVALHRAAYLLYTHRFPLERQGVLVVGPNQVFLRYVAHVLPSLGENGVALSTVEGLVGGPRPTGEEPPAVARLKGDARLAAVLAKAVRDRERPLRGDLEVPFGARRLRLGQRELSQLVATVRRRRTPHNLRRTAFEAALLGRLLAQVPGLVGDGERTADAREELRRHPVVVEALERMWPRLSAEEFLHDLFGAPALIDLAAGRLLGPAERALLHRPRQASPDAVAWTQADLPLLDEARTLLGPRRLGTSGSSAESEPRTYGHVVIDEAQELTPMQLRVVGRRSLGGSLTVVGDLSQAGGSSPPADWSAVLAHLGVERPSRIAGLTVNYRTPGPVMEVAARVLAVARPGAPVPRSARPGGRPPLYLPVDEEGLAEAVATTAGRLSAEEPGRSVGVVVPPARAGEVVAALSAVRCDLELGDLELGDLEQPIAVVPVALARGVEFDTTIVVEPAAIVDDPELGPGALYVALTRATRRLVVVHALPLPAAMQSPSVLAVAAAE